MGVAAYAFFAPFVPEAFTSPGPSTIYFDKNNKRFSVRRFGRSRTWRRWMARTRRSSRATRRRMRIPSRTSSAPAQRRRMQRPSRRWCSMRPGARARSSRRRCARSCRTARSGTTSIRTSRPGFALSRRQSAGDQRAVGRRKAISQFDPNVFTLTQFGFRRLQVVPHQRQRRQPDADAEGHRVRRTRDAAARAGSAVRGRRRTVGLMLPM